MGNLKKSGGIRICIISVPLLDIVGSDVFLKQFLEIMEPICQKIYVITGGFSEAGSQKIHIISKLKSWNVTESLTARISRYILAQLRSSASLIRISNNYDLVILYSGAQLYLIPALIGKLCRKKVILVHQGSYSKPFRLAYGKRWFGLGMVFYWALWLWEEIVLRLSYRLVIESEKVVEFSGLGKYERKIFLGDYCYIDTDLFTIKQPLERRRKLVGYIGQFLEEKGVMAFAKAVPLVTAEYRDVEFLMVGKIGSSNSRVEEELKRTNSYNKVTIMERIHPQQVPDFLNKLKLLVLPSASEGLPGILRQAMACGTPVLATPVGGVPDLIKDEETGFILENNSPECITKNIIRVLEHPKLGEIIKKARALIEKEYTYEPAVKRWKKVFDLWVD